MNWPRAWRSFQVACVYIGTVVGAGFASGQEIYQFFVRFGTLGYIGVCLATCFFAWFGFRMMALGRKLSASSFRDLNAYLFRGWFAHVVDALYLLMLFGVTVAMLAGAGEIFRERLGFAFSAGVLFTVLVAFFTLTRGMTGILASNVVIVPTMLTFVLYAFVHTMMHVGISLPFVQINQALKGTTVFPMLISGVIYSALNIGLSAGVLVPLGSQIQDRKALKYGAMAGALGLGLMLAALSFTLFAYAPNVFQYAVPMGYVAAKLGPFLQWGFVIVLWGEIFSTLVGNVFGLSAEVMGRSEQFRAIYTGGLLFVAALCSQVGFTNLVAYGYTIFGWVSLLILFGLCWPR